MLLLHGLGATGAVWRDNAHVEDPDAVLALVG